MFNQNQIVWNLIFCKAICLGIIVALEQMGNSNKLRKDAFEFYKDERNFYYLKLAPGADFSISYLEDIKTYIEDVYSGQVLPFLIELGYQTNVSARVQAHLSKTKYRYSSADAILISTFAHKTMVNFYTRHFKPEKTRVFNDVFDALDWIEKQAPVVSTSGYGKADEEEDW